jgi:uncharacterized protein
MLLALSTIIQTPDSVLPFETELDLRDMEFGGSYPVTEAVKAVGTVRNTAGVLILTAQITTVLHGSCDRCATDVKRDYSFPVEHTLVVALESGDNDDFLEVPNMRLDLDALVEEDVNLALPSKYLCNEECKGLCPTCGKNLNKDQCDCKAPIDPRMEVLLKLLEE